MAAGAVAINHSLYRDLPFDILKDFAPVTLVATVPNVLAVHPRTWPWRRRRCCGCGCSPAPARLPVRAA
jgi:hypothetical protein